MCQVAFQNDFKASPAIKTEATDSKIYKPFNIIEETWQIQTMKKTDSFKEKKFVSVSFLITSHVNSWLNLKILQFD